MDKLSWLKDLIRADQEMEETGVVDFTAGYNPETEVLDETTRFLIELKNTFVDFVTVFNQMKENPQGRIKVYAISKTRADFMLFRNGFKAIFSMKEPGRIGISLAHVGSAFHVPGKDMEVPEIQEDCIESQQGAFGKINWSYQGHPLNVEHMAKFYLTRFIRESVQ